MDIASYLTPKAAAINSVKPYMVSCFDLSKNNEYLAIWMAVGFCWDETSI